MQDSTAQKYRGRLGLLNAELRQLRQAVDVRSTGATIHQLRNYVQTAQAALSLAEARLRGAALDEAEFLLALAATRLREGRALLTTSSLARGVHRMDAPRVPAFTTATHTQVSGHRGT